MAIRADRAAITHIATTEEIGIRIEYFAVQAAEGRTERIILADHRRKIAGANQAAPALRRNPHEDDDIVVSVVSVDEMKSPRLRCRLPTTRAQLGKSDLARESIHARHDDHSLRASANRGYNRGSIHFH